MINSRNAVRDQLTVIRSGEQVASSIAALKDPNARTYHHLIPGARFCMPDGLELQFLGGMFVTADADIIAELDKVANKTTSMIYTKQEVVGAVTANNAKVAAEAGDTAGTITK